MEMINRRGLITGLISFVAAPAIVRASSLMPVKNMNNIIVGVDLNDLYGWNAIYEIWYEDGVVKTTFVKECEYYKGEVWPSLLSN